MYVWRNWNGLRILGLTLVLLIAVAVQARAADRARIEAFLVTTGFDVALESIRLSAGTAPEMLGFDADDFGPQWTRLVRDVFDTDYMHGFAIDILEETLSEDLLTHASDFYASSLGQRLVKAENTSHMLETEGLKTESGEAIINGLVRIGSSRVALLRRLTNASNVADNSIRAIQEVQVRFLMAAAGAGVLDLTMDEPDLREVLRQNENAVRLVLQSNALSGAAYTYQAFSDDEIEAYAKALEAPKMREVYALLNAVQFEIMADRFEAIAVRLKGLQPSQDL